MRLTSAIWFAVFMRKEQERGAFVSVVKTGAQQAGAIFVVHNHLNGSYTLYAPAPQSLAASDLDDDRSFEVALSACDQAALDGYLDKQKKFDSDLWIIETESAEGSPDINIVTY